MSDYKETSLHEELEVRVIALLTGELGESEADELEKILAINPELSAFRDRMAKMMGELHRASDELSESKGEAPSRLSEDRRARIFGDASLIERDSKLKRIHWKATFYGVAAAVCMLFFLSAVLIPSFNQVRSLTSVTRSEALFEAAPPPPSEPEYKVNLERRDSGIDQLFDRVDRYEAEGESYKMVVPAAPQSFSVSSSSEIAVPELNIDLNVEDGALDGRASGLGSGGGLSGIREMSLRKRDSAESADISGDSVPMTGRLYRGNDKEQYFARAGETIAVEVPAERIEGTPMPIQAPNLEPAPTAAPRMVVSGERLASKLEGFEEINVFEESAEWGLDLNAAGYTAPLKAKQENAKLGEKKREGMPGDDAVLGLDGVVKNARPNVDPFAPSTVDRDESELADVDGEFIRIRPETELTAVEKMAQQRAQKVRQTPKPEKLASEEPFSTFSLNISDVSFKLAQAALANSRVPPSAQIRTEEFVNSFNYGDPAPRADEPVSLNWEIAQHPFEHDRQVVRFSLQTQASGRASGQPLNLSLLVDNSGSMQRPDRQAILQNSLQTLESKLTPQDKLNVVLFARQPRLIAEAQTRASQKEAVETALAYRPEGGTNLEAGLQAAYESAQRNYLSAGSNRVILMTDGAANLGNVNAGELADLVVEQRKRGVALDAYGIGWDDYNDALLEEITRNGDGRYAFLNSVEDASEDFAEKLAGTLRVAAADVKVQIEWNPDRVKRYRQIGYDLHQLKKEDFRDNTVDAAEIGEAESGTALYVLQINEDPEIIGGLGTLNVRYREPATGLYRELSWPLPMPRRVPDASAASPSMRLAMSSAFFGERLAGSPFAAGYSFEDLYSIAAGLPEAFPSQPRVAQLQTMLLQASELFREK